MTDNEIKKALECLEADTNCSDCALYDKKECKGECVFTNALDLINRQELKIKGLNRLLYSFLDTRNGDLVHITDNELEFIVKPIKAEAYKEFAKKAVEQVEKARQKYQRLCKEQGEEMEEHMHIHFNGIIKIINNLLKEKVGEQDENIC